MLELLGDHFLRLWKYDSVKEIFDFFAFVFVTPEFAGEERVDRFRAWLGRLFARILPRQFEAKPLMAGLYFFAGFCMFGGTLAVYVIEQIEAARGLQMDPLKALQILFITALPLAGVMLIDLAPRLVTRIVFFSLGAILFVVARGMGIWSAIKVS